MQIGGCKPGPEGRCCCPPRQQPIFKLAEKTGCEISFLLKTRAEEVKQAPLSEAGARPEEEGERVLAQGPLETWLKAAELSQVSLQWYGTGVELNVGKK